MEEIRTLQVWIGKDLYKIEYPVGLEMDGLQSDKTDQQIPQAETQANQEAIQPIDDEWDERRGIFYTVIQMIFAFLILTQGASIVKSVIIASVLLFIGLSQLGYISWSNWLVKLARFIQPAPIGEQEPIWKTIFLLSMKFIMSMFPGLNDV